MLPWAAALGRSFGVDLLGKATGVAPIDLIGALEELERHALVRVCDDATYDFAHDLLRESAYREMSEPRRQLVHRQIAAVLAPSMDADAALAGEVAHHAGVGGEHELAARACVRAGQRSLALFAYKEAAEFGDRGLAHAAHLPDAKRLALAVQLMRVHGHAGMDRARLGELTTRLYALAEEAREAGMYAEVHACFTQLLILEFFEGDFASMNEVGARAEEVVGDEPARARMLARQGLCFAYLGHDMARAHRVLREAVDLARKHGLELADLESGLGYVARYAGDVDAARARLTGGATLAQKDKDHFTAYSSVTELVLVEIEERRYDQALARCDDLAPLAKELGEGSEAPVVASLRGLVQLLAGDRSAREPLDRALESLRSFDHKRMLAYVLTALAELDLEGGRTELARANAEEAVRVAEAVGRHEELGLARSVLARAAHAVGDHAAARREIAQLKSDLAKKGTGARARVAAARAASEVEPKASRTC
jgi:tetratricopeptide (TPR) repeat protein